MDVTLPDGTTVRGIPDGTTKAQLADKLRANGMNVPDAWMKPAELGNMADRIPGTPAQPKPGAEQDSGIVDRALGAGEAALSAVTSIPAGVAGGAAGALETLTSGKFGTQEGIQQGDKRAAEVAQSLTYAPRRESGRKALRSMSDIIEASRVQGLNPAMPLGAASEAGVGAVKRAAGGAVARATEVAKGGAAKVADTLTPAASPDVARMAARAQELGIHLRPDMLSDNKIVRMVGEALEKVPLSGSKAEQRQAAFNAAIGKLIGAENAKRITPDVFDRAISAAGKKIGDIAGKTKVPLAGPLLDELSGQVSEAAKFETADVGKVVTNYVAELRGKAVDGVIPGEALRKLNSKIGRQARATTNGDLKSALGDLQDSIHDAIARSLSPEDLKSFQDARRQYAIAKTVEPLVAKAKNGDISPAGLMGAVTSDGAKKSAMARGRGGDLGELAKIGQMFLKEPESSGTTERGLAYALLGGGAAVEPHTAGAIYAGANVYNRLGPSVARRMAMKGMARELRDTPIKELP